MRIDLGRGARDGWSSVSAYTPARHLFAALLAAFFAFTNAETSSIATANEPPVETWLRDADENLELRLHGEIFDANGQPAEGVKITGSQVITGRDDEPIEFKVDGHRFEAWIPVNKGKTHAVRLHAASGEETAACLMLMSYKLRQAAIEGVELRLAPAPSVTVRILADGKPAPHAWLNAEFDNGYQVETQADSQGVARFAQPPHQSLQRLTAWNDAHRIGGGSLAKMPNRNAEEFVVNLEKCRQQNLRVVDEQGQPVASAAFTLNVATPAPDYDYIGVNDDFRLVSDEQGNAICRSFPDWEKVHFYAEPADPAWHLVGETAMHDGVIVIPVKRNVARHAVTARLRAEGTSPGGFNVSISSFQGERENYSDETRRFTNADGSCILEVLPDATYCAYPFDAQWTGPTIDWIPYDSKTNKTTPLELTVAASKTLTIIATAGPAKTPLARLGVSISQRHEFSWREDGETRSSEKGPQYWIWTDDAGQAQLPVNPGEARAFVYTDDWRTEQTINVVAGQAATLALHRPVAGPRTIRGQLVREEGVNVPLGGLEVVAGAIDGNFNKVERVTADADGRFELESTAQQLGFFARTPDGAATAAAVVSDLDQPVTLTLRPTLDYRGQLLGKDDKPLQHHGVRAIVRIVGDEDYNGMFVKSFEAARIETKTDAEGRYMLTGVPSEMPARLHADALDGDENGVYLEEFYLQPGESRPPSVNRLAPAAVAATTPDPLAVRFERMLRDARLGGFRMIVIAAGDDSPELKEFVSRYLSDYQENKNAGAFMQFLLPADRSALSADDKQFIAEQEWSLPPRNSVWALACDANGAEIARLQLDLSAADAAQVAKEFVNEHAPPTLNARKKWREAFALAKQTDRRVWIRISQRYCGPCFRLARWIEDCQPTIEKDYVLLKIDDVRDLHGVKVAKRLTRGKHHGVPFHAIFDADETLLIDSAGPLGNIGHPSDYEGKNHLRKMFTETKQRLTEAQIEDLIKSLE